MNRYKENIVPALVALALVVYIWPIRITTGLTSSGAMIFFASDLIMLVLCGCNFIVYIKNRKIYDANNIVKTMEWAYIAILVVYGGISAYRLVNGLYVYHSFDACFRTLAPLSLALFILKDAKTYKLWLRWINYAITFINIYSAIYHIGIYKLLRSNFLLNVNMVAFLCVADMFINSLALKNSKKNIIQSLIFIFNVIYNITVFCVVGSRAAAFIGGLSVLFVLVCFLNRNNLKYYVIAGVLTISVVAMLWTTNFGFCRSLMMRGFNLTTISESIDKMWNGEKKPAESFVTEQIETEEIEATTEICSEEKVKNEAEPVAKAADSSPKSEVTESTIEEVSQPKTTEDFVTEGLREGDAIRFSCWEAAIHEIMTEPIFGTGKVGVADSEAGVQSAHNFILEYCLIYGVGGFAVWVVFVVSYLVKVIRAADKKMLRRVIFGLFGLLCTTLGFSFFEVTMITTFGSLVVWLAVFLYSASILYGEE